MYIGGRITQQFIVIYSPGQWKRWSKVRRWIIAKVVLLLAITLVQVGRAKEPIRLQIYHAQFDTENWPLARNLPS